MNQSTSPLWQVWWLALPVLMLFAGALTEPLLPGVYMDSVNPDYLVARLYSNGTDVGVWVLPGNMIFGWLPLMPSIYHGALPFWLGAPIYAVFGTDVFGIRLTHATFAALLIAAAWAMLRQFGVRPAIAALALSALAIDPGFLFAFRSAFYITTIPGIFLFASIALVWGSLTENRPQRWWVIFLAGVAAGIAVYGYFIFTFYVAVFGLCVLATRRRALIVPFVSGAALGILPVIAGWAAFSIASGTLTAIPDTMARMVAGTAPAMPFVERPAFIFRMWWLVFTGDGLAAMMAGLTSGAALTSLRAVLLVLVPLAVLVWSEVSRRPLVALRFLLLLMLTPPIVFGLLFGSRLWAHHFILVLPLLYCAAAVAYSRLLLPATSAHIGIAVGTLALVLFINVSNVLTFVDRLRITGGVGRMSEAINRFSEDARGDAAAYFVPDWGLFMPLAMITHGQVEIIVGFDADYARRRLCAGDNVVVTSIGPDAAKDAPVRAAAVVWPDGASEIYAQRDGVPIIYATRWSAAAAGTCP